MQHFVEIKSSFLRPAERTSQSGSTNSAEPSSESKAKSGGTIMAVRTSSLTGGIGLIEVKGALTGGEETDEVRRAVAGFIDREYSKLIIDLGGVTFVNSAGIGVLVGAHTTYTRKGWHIKLTGVNKNIDSVFVITKLSLVFDVHDTIGEAQKSFT